MRKSLITDIILRPILILVGCSVVLAVGDANNAPSDAIYTGTKAIGHSLKNEMCSFLLNNNDQNPFELDNIVKLLESALDHLAKATEYVTHMRPHVKTKVVNDYDKYGGMMVLAISQAITSLNEEYEQAASKDEKQEILENYFYKACSFKLGTVQAEQSMLKAVQKTEEVIGKKLLPY